MKKYIILLLLFCQCTLCALADGISYIKNYNVSMVVHENNSYDVKENVTVHFAEPMHGFYRYVPYKYYMMDKTYICKVGVNDVLGDQYTTSKENDNVLIKIGNPDVTITGDKDYEIDYTITNVDDRISEKDVFNHSVMGADMNFYIDTLSFSITFEKPLPADAKDNIRVYSGSRGTKRNKLGVKIWLKGNTLLGYVQSVPQNCPVTIDLTLPEGYYQGEQTSSPTYAYIFFAITILLCIILLYYEFTVKHPSVTKQIEFYPPQGLCSAELGTVIDDSADNEDLASLIPWFASEGYITIAEKEESKFFGLGSKKYLEITNTHRDGMQLQPYQRTFFNALFSGSNGVVRLDKLPDVHEEIASAKDQLSYVFSGAKELTTWHKTASLIILLFIVSSLFLVATLHGDMFENDDFIVYSITWCAPFIACGMWIFKTAAKAKVEDSLKIGAFRLLRGLLMLFCMGLNLWIIDDIQVGAWMICAVYIACYAALEFMANLCIDTEYRASLMGELLGFKEFLETAEEPRLRSLLEADPQYFYRILPYAMALGVSKIWAEHFAHIKMEQPEWYTSSTPGTHFMAHNFVSNIMSASDSAISCMSPSSSGSGSGGSGGGTGGGGGGGW